MTNQVNVSGLRNEMAKWAELARKARKAGEFELLNKALLERDLLQEEIDLRLVNAEVHAPHRREARGTRDRAYGTLRIGRAVQVANPDLDEAKALRAAKREREAGRNWDL